MQKTKNKKQNDDNDKKEPFWHKGYLLIHILHYSATFFSCN